MKPIHTEIILWIISMIVLMWASVTQNTALAIWGLGIVLMSIFQGYAHFQEQKVKEK